LTQSYPPHAGYGPPQQYQPQPRNGFGITALVVGLIAICLGFKGAAPSAAAPAAPGAPTDASTPVEESKTGAFGQKYTWPDGVAVTVSGPKAYRPSSSAATSQTAVRYVSMTVTVTNLGLSSRLIFL